MPTADQAAAQPWTQAEVKQFVDALVGKRLAAPALLTLMGVGPA
jgi:hypothetical protein